MTTNYVYGVPTPLRASVPAGVTTRTSADMARRHRGDVCPQVMTAQGTGLSRTGMSGAGRTSVERVVVTGAEKQLAMFGAITQRAFVHLPSGSTAQSPG